MQHIVLYDIADAKRLKRVAKLCLDFGVRMQYSAFLFDLNKESAREFLAAVAEIIDRKRDSVIVLPLCKDCLSGARTLGIAKSLQQPVFLDF